MGPKIAAQIQCVTGMNTGIVERTTYDNPAMMFDFDFMAKPRGSCLNIVVDDAERAGRAASCAGHLKGTAKAIFIVCGRPLTAEDDLHQAGFGAVQAFVSTRHLRPAVQWR